MSEKIAVLGAGSWGTALAMVLAENGHQVTLWGNNPQQMDLIQATHTNPQYLGDTLLPESIQASCDLEATIEGAGTILFVVPTKAIRPVARQLAPLLKNQPLLIHASKGLEQNTFERISTIIKEEIPRDAYDQVVILSGPSHAEEVARKDLTTITAACCQLDAAQKVQRLFSNAYFRVYTNQDEVGVELGAALKNVIALGAGILHGLGYGDNAKAGLMTRGLAEITRLGVAFGADPLTFIGLSGVGDLIVTCTSVHSRNWRAGHQLGQGQSLDQVLDHMGMVVEGVETCKAAYALAKEKGIDMPITQAVYQVLYEGVQVRDAVTSLMTRDFKAELATKN